jgi:hypothetical protein
MARPIVREKAPPGSNLADELAILQSQRRAAISSCDFAKTRILDCNIDRLKDEIAATTAASSQIENKLTFDLKKEALRAKASQLLENARDEVLRAQSAYQERLIQLHNSHGDELAHWGERYAAALELETTRANPTAEHLKRQAQFSAQQRDYGAAEALMEESEAVRRRQIEKNQGETTRVFEEQRLRIVSRQENELALCHQRLLRDTQAIQIGYQKELATIKHSLAKTAVDVRRPLTPEAADFLDEFVLVETVQIPTSPKSPPTERSTGRVPGSSSGKAKTAPSAVTV